MTEQRLQEPIAWLTRGEQVVKQPNESYRVGFNWTDLARAEIRSSSWTVQNANPNLVNCAMRIEDETFDRHRTQVSIVGGVVGHLYVVTNIIESTNGRIDRAFTVAVRS